MKKTLLFGAGAGAFSFISNEKEQRKILACIDNDEKKCGNKINGVSIILPKDIKNYDYDEIVITTQWADEVKEQLINDYSIKLEKIVNPEKSLLKLSNKPFEDEETLRFAKKVITFLCGKAKKENIPLHIDYGTLLGIIRDKNILPWDDDIDLASIDTSSDEVEKFVLDNINLIDSDVSWSIKKTLDKNNNPIQLNLTFSSLNNKYKYFDISIAYKGIVNNKAIKLASLGQWFTPKHHVLKLDTIIWENTELFVPSDYEKYLEFTYGSWKIPKKTMSISEGCGAQVAFEVFKEAGFKTTKIL